MPSFTVDAAELGALASTLAEIGNSLDDPGRRPPLGALAGSHGVADRHAHVLHLLTSAADRIREDLNQTAESLRAAAGAYSGTERNIVQGAAAAGTAAPGSGHR